MEGKSNKIIEFIMYLLIILLIISILYSFFRIVSNNAKKKEQPKNSISVSPIIGENIKTLDYTRKIMNS